MGGAAQVARCSRNEKPGPTSRLFRCQFLDCNGGHVISSGVYRAPTIRRSLPLHLRCIRRTARCPAPPALSCIPHRDSCKPAIYPAAHNPPLSAVSRRRKAARDSSWSSVGNCYVTSFGIDYNPSGVKPVDDNKASQYKDSDHAGTPENFKAFVIGGATGGGRSNFTGSYSGTGSCALTRQPTTSATVSQ